MIKWFCNHYLGGPADIDNWRASPARAQTLAGLPPAYVLTAGADPLRDEGDEYAARLKEAGVAVTYRHFPGQFHGFFTMGKLLQPGQCRGQRNRRLAEGAELDGRPALRFGESFWKRRPRSRSPSTRCCRAG